MSFLAPLKDFFAAFADRGPTPFMLEVAHVEAAEVEQDIAARLADLPPPLGYFLAGNLHGLLVYSGTADAALAKDAVRSQEDARNGFYRSEVETIEKLVMKLAKNDNVTLDRLKTFLARQTRAPGLRIRVNED